MALTNQSGAVVPYCSWDSIKRYVKVSRSTFSLVDINLVSIFRVLFRELSTSRDRFSPIIWAPPFIVRICRRYDIHPPENAARYLLDQLQLLTILLPSLMVNDTNWRFNSFLNTNSRRATPSIQSVVHHTSNGCTCFIERIAPKREGHVLISIRILIIISIAKLYLPVPKKTLVAYTTNMFTDPLLWSESVEGMTFTRLKMPLAQVVSRYEIRGTSGSRL